MNKEEFLQWFRSQPILTKYQILRKKAIQSNALKQFNLSVNLYAEVEGLDKIPDGIQCVYLIEDFYIGRTTNLRNRILCHVGDCLATPTDIEKGTYNLGKIKEIKKILETRKLKVKIIDYDLTKESEYILKYRAEGYQLTNQTHYLK